MAHYTNLADVNLSQPATVSIGVFDGVHLGHQSLIKHLVTQAKQSNHLTVVITFFPHPDVVLRNIDPRYYLTTPEERAHLLADLGVDVVITHPFNEDVRQIRAETFIQQLVERLQMRELYVGSDFALGYQREGNLAKLTELGERYNYSVHALDLVPIDGKSKPISSSSIRKLLTQGDMENVTQLLGRAYAIQGIVKHGHQRGRTIGFPTANIDLWDYQYMPRLGVFACQITVHGEQYHAVTNIGIRPTFEGNNITVEAHIFDFNADIYDQNVTLTLEHFIRSEIKFDGIESLKAQLTQDKQTARDWLEKNTPLK